MAGYVYGDDAPSTYIRQVQHLRAYLHDIGVSIHPLDAEPLGVVSATIAQLQLYHECHEDMGRLHDYLAAQGYLDHAPPMGRLVDTVMGVLAQYAAMVHASPAEVALLAQQAPRVQDGGR